MGLVRDEELDRCDDRAPCVWPTCRTRGISLVSGRADPGHSANDGVSESTLEPTGKGFSDFTDAETETQVGRSRSSLPPWETELDPSAFKTPIFGKVNASPLTV